MGFTADTPTVAGVVLLREAIQSPNYVVNVSGWTINQDGTVEFNNATLRGELRVNGTNGSYIRIFSSGGIPIMALTPADYSDPVPDAAPQNPGAIFASPEDAGLSSRAYTQILSPEFANPGYNTAIIRAYGEPFDHSSGTEILLGAATTSVNGDLAVVGATDVQALTANGVVNFGAATPESLSGNGTNGTTAATAFTNTLGATGIHGVAFIAPPSGAVYVAGRAAAGNNTLNAFSLLDFEVRNGSTIGSGTVVRASVNGNAGVFQSSVANAQGMVVTDDIVTGLTPGNTYNVALTYQTGGTGTSSYNRRHITVLPQGNI